MKSPSMHGMKGAMSPVIRGPGGPGMSAGRNDPVGARDEVSGRRRRWGWGGNRGHGSFQFKYEGYFVVVMGKLVF